MMYKLYSISYFWSQNFPRPTVVEDKLNYTSKDWIRFSNSQWFVWTSTPKAQLVSELRTIVLDDEQFAVMALMPEAADGFAKPWIWEWINDKMNRQFRGE